jgi:hypothetical protein
MPTSLKDMEKSLVLRLVLNYNFVLIEYFVLSIADFVSYYTLPSTVMNHPVHKSLKAAYSFYNVSTNTPMIELMNDALVSAKNVSSSAAVSFDLIY